MKLLAPVSLVIPYKSFVVVVGCFFLLILRLITYFNKVSEEYLPEFEKLTVVFSF